MEGVSCSLSLAQSGLTKKVRKRQGLERALPENFGGETEVEDEGEETELGLCALKLGLVGVFRISAC